MSVEKHLQEAIRSYDEDIDTLEREVQELGRRLEGLYAGRHALVQVMDRAGNEAADKVPQISSVAPKKAKKKTASKPQNRNYERAEQLQLAALEVLRENRESLGRAEVFQILKKNKKKYGLGGTSSRQTSYPSLSGASGKQYRR